MEQEVQEKSAEKKQKVKEKERSDEMRARTEENPKYDPDDTKSLPPLHFLNSTAATREFTDRLEQERALLEPFARAVKCLESSASTPADVCLFWLAYQATLKDLFTDEGKRDALMLTEDTIDDVRAIVNARFSKMIEGPDRQVYLTTLFLDPHYLGSPLFTRKHINPLSTVISIPGNRLATSAVTSEARRLPDADLRASLPTYVSSGAYLGQLLANELNAQRLPNKVTSSYSSPGAIIEEFRVESESYARQRPPFDRYSDLRPFEYWTRQARHFDARVLAFPAVKLYSIVPNSMAEERTISNFTKLNSSDRGRQKPSTLVRMTQIKQHEQRRRKAPGSERPNNLAVRFRDLSDMLCSKNESGPAPEIAAGSGTRSLTTSASTQLPQIGSAGAIPQALEDVELDMWEKDAGVVGEMDRPLPGARDCFEVAEADGVNLDEPLLLDLLSDEPVPGVAPRGGYSVKNSKNAPASTAIPGANTLVAYAFEF